MRGYAIARFYRRAEGWEDLDFNYFFLLFLSSKASRKDELVCLLEREDISITRCILSLKWA